MSILDGYSTADGSKEMPELLPEDVETVLSKKKVPTVSFSKVLIFYETSCLHEYINLSYLIYQHCSKAFII
jgi:hypothetical protein